MPIYEYRCSICNHEFETLQKVGARALTKCPECSGKLEKLVSRTSFQLKGGGWFEQGYGGPRPGGAKAGSGAGDGATAKAADPPAKPPKPSKPSGSGES